MQDFERYRLIEQYLNDELSSSERMRFEENLAQDPALAQEVELYALSNEVVFENRLLDIKQKIQSDFSNNNTSSGWNKYIIPTIIGIGLIAGIGGYIYSSKEDPLTSQKNKSVEQVSTIQQNNTEKTGTTEKNTSAAPSFNPATNSAATSNADQIKTANPAKTDSVHVHTGAVQQIKTPISDPIVVTPKTDNTNKALMNPPKEKADPCANVTLTAEFKLTPACKGTATGEIQVLLSKTTGGKAPYSYAINDESFGMASYFNDLKKGTYTIHVKDQNNCTQLFLKEIKEVNCVQSLDDYSFNPTRGQTWKYENKSMTAAHIQILDKSGMLVKSYSSLQPGQQVEWDGKSDQGNDVQMGGYVCLISYDNGTVEKGMIIIYQ
jgi:hypothetical protein